MSEFHINVVTIESIIKHPNADTLSIAKVFDYQVIVRTGDYSEGEKAVYVPVDSIMPDTEQWKFLGPKDSEFTGGVPARYRRIRAKKLRGVFSQGMLSKLPVNPQGLEWNVGDDVCEVMGITKWEPQEENLSTSGECEKMPGGWEFVKYTDIEGMRRYPRVIEYGENVVLTEKLHGANSRYIHDGARLWVGSRTQIKRDTEDSVWWNVARQFEFAQKLASFPMTIFFGEVFGKVQDLNYGIGSGATFRCFDTFDIKTMKYNDWSTTVNMCEQLNIPLVPVLYVGPWEPDLKKFAEGNSTLASHVREGFVVKPVVERWEHSVGRVILKMIGEAYLLRKD